MYNYFGYYQVCYLADEVAAPARTIPRSILISVLLVAFMYVAMNLAVLGVIPWRAVAAPCLLHHLDVYSHLRGREVDIRNSAFGNSAFSISIRGTVMRTGVSETPLHPTARLSDDQLRAAGIGCRSPHLELAA